MTKPQQQMGKNSNFKKWQGWFAGFIAIFVIVTLIILIVRVTSSSDESDNKTSKPPQPTTKIPVKTPSPIVSFTPSMTPIPYTTLAPTKVPDSNSNSTPTPKEPSFDDDDLPIAPTPPPETSFDPNLSYRIKNVWTNQYLIKDGTTFKISNSAPQNTGEWKFQRVGTNQFLISNANSNKVLQVKNNSTPDRQSFVLEETETCTNTDFYKNGQCLWEIKNKGSGSYWIKNLLYSVFLVCSEQYDTSSMIVTYIWVLDLQPGCDGITVLKTCNWKIDRNI